MGEKLYKTNSYSLDVSLLHWETGEYPVFRLLSSNFQFIGGYEFNIDLNAGRYIGEMNNTFSRGVNIGGLYYMNF
jgi:hypothetical protein